VQEKNKFHVVEKDTGLTIAEKNSEKGARDVCRALNLGSGFDGFTPTFFTETFKQKERPSRI
jgi:hypothetical protein